VLTVLFCEKPTFEILFTFVFLTSKLDVELDLTLVVNPPCMMLSNEVVDTAFLSAGMLLFLTIILELDDRFLFEVFHPEFTAFIELELELEFDVSV